jgi:very-short-patch-repair endonuclease
MRAHPTEAEKRLWSMLRVKRLAAFKFKRQVIIRPYIVDFVCSEQRLIIEADGSQHADNKYDERRDAFLRAQDFEILRFWNNQVLGETSAVAEAIYAVVLAPSPSHACGVGPSLSRKGRGASNGAPSNA